MAKAAQYAKRVCVSSQSKGSLVSIHEVAWRMPHRLKRRAGEKREYTLSLPLLAQWSSTLNTKATVCQCAEEPNQLSQWQKSLKSASHTKHKPVNKTLKILYVSMKSDFFFSFDIKKNRRLKFASTEWEQNSKKKKKKIWNYRQKILTDKPKCTNYWILTAVPSPATCPALHPGIVVVQRELSRKGKVVRASD